MSSLISRSAVLTASRVSNFSIQLFSPLLLVRILDVVAYGQYQEFMVYAVLVATICTFSIDRSLTYFIPRYPDREQAFVTQTSLVTLASSVVILGGLLLLKPALLRFVSYDFVALLCIYVFLFVNLDWLESYWIAKRQARLVLYYSAVRLGVRVLVLLLVAYFTRDVTAIIWSMVAVEALRLALIFGYFYSRGQFVSDLRRSEVMEQLRFSGPLGASNVLQKIGSSIGKVAVSTVLGPAALAYYVAGSYLKPIIRVARSGIEDAVYPELVRAHDKPGGALKLWQRMNVLYCAMFFPAFVVLVYYAEQIVTLLFTSDYLPAVPIFQIYALFLLRRCFNTDVLLRTTGRTGFMVWGTLGSLVINIAVIFPLTRWLGIIGPALAFIAAEIALELYYAYRAMRTLKLTAASLGDWRRITRIVASCALALPILLGLELLAAPHVAQVLAASALYFATVLWIAHRLGVDDIGRVGNYVLSRLGGRRTA